jgi:hypothetical protein
VSASRKTDQSLLKAVARAHCWFDDLVRGRSMVEIAKRNGVGKQYVSRLIRLAFLAPEIVERIVASRQPPELTAQVLRTGRFNLPVDWAEQKRTLRICAAGLSSPIGHCRPAAHLFFCCRIASNLLPRFASELRRFKAKSTAEAGNREKSAKLVFEPEETSSPVDLRC